ncbi:SDR family oxidoreductase [Flavobacterium sp. MC2016-06]|jgi:NAD(P)-dependent dehydrogenase (short-subunit alcohol dehydrogenase family)|uniref:SDR family NAD(P)-dependent oxidoreductase n=1 Tax=Flavobacterium sp. MC2016-06 TaxID=2676308 RepID=UPI0012BAE777|nr:SDR family oxidoreductase [Flavobacterium sp. MC2016-06]MBU3861587.1 SDR family oxidoreductase [Flavobacterium sp. MC2016-06]
MKKLENKIAVITGATSGMALATAKLFVEQGAYVFITGRRQKELDEAAAFIGSNVTGVVCDSSNLKDLDYLFETIKNKKGSIDILYASAGIFEFAPIGQITEDHFDKQFNTNTKGTLFTVQKALPLFNDHGSIIMTGSIAALKGDAYTSVYSATKATLSVFAKCWTSDLKSRGIRVNVIHPGPIDTAIWSNLNEEQKEGYISKVPLGRVGKPQEIASTALFLASDDSSYITGTSISVDGGTGQV